MSAISSLAGIPDLTAGASARALLNDIHRSIGHTEGVLEELTRQISELASTLHGHIEDEAGEIKTLSEQSAERHGRLNRRLDELEQAAITNRIRWGVILTIGAAVGTVATTIIGAAISGNLSHLTYMLGVQ